MSILDRTSLEQSSLSDLHAIASELSIDSFRRLRKGELVDAILERQGSDQGTREEEETEAEEPAPRPEEAQGRDDEAKSSRRRRLRRGRRRDGDEPEAGSEAGGGAEESPTQEEDPSHADGPEDEAGAAEAEPDEEPATGPSQSDVVEGVVEVLSGGSGFVRLSPPEPSDDDVYISAAQVRRCELVSGDRVTGPRRPPRRSERFPSLIRVDTVNGRPASELANGTRFDDLPITWPSQPLPLTSEDATVSALLSVAPIGRGSRVTIAGPPQSGKTEILKRLAAALSGQPELELRIVLAGVRPEEIPEWQAFSPSSALGLEASMDARSQAVEGAVEQARRLAVRGAHAVVLIDSLDGVHETAARRALAAARAIADGGSLTVIVAASHPLGGETAVVALSPLLAAAGRWPALDLIRTWTMRAEALVGEDRAQEIGRMRAQALDG